MGEELRSHVSREEMTVVRGSKVGTDSSLRSRVPREGLWANDDDASLRWCLSGLRHGELQD